MADSIGQGRFPVLRHVDEAAGSGIISVVFDNNGDEQLVPATLGSGLQYIPLSNGDPDNPALIFADGQVVLVPIEV